MDIVKFTERFQEVELKYNLFQLKNEEGLLYWDIVRHNVFYAIYYQLTDMIPISKDSSNNIYSKIKNLCYYGFHYIKLSLNLKRISCTYICFTNSRYKDAENKNIDYAMEDVLSIIKNDNTLILESNIQFGEQYHYPSFFNVGLTIASYKNKVKTFFQKKGDYPYEVTKILQKEFNLSISLDSTINETIKQYRIEYRYYKKLLENLLPKKIFLVQNGIQKALFTVANVLGIEVYELQHGLVSFIHPAYNYPESIFYKNLKTFPTYFLSFSSFWSNNINYPVQRTITIGNSFFAQKIIALKSQFELTVISADIYVKDLIYLIDELLKSNFKGKIAFKLHPNQFQDFDCIKKHFEPYPNVIVISTQFSIKELLSLSNSILAVQSTCVYEALYNQVKVLLYKIKDYKTHEDVFSNPNVYQFTDALTIKEYLQEKYILVAETVFFENFKEAEFKQLLIP